MKKVMTGMGIKQFNLIYLNFVEYREVADFRTAGIFIRDTASFHCDSMNCDSYFSKSQ